MIFIHSLTPSTLSESEKFGLLHRIKLSVSKKGRARPSSVKKKISQTMKGKSNFKGQAHSKSDRDKISSARGHYDPIGDKKWFVKKDSGKTIRKRVNPSGVIYQHGRRVRKESFMSFQQFTEAYYVGNVGIHELTKFYKIASKEHKDQLKKHISSGDHNKAFNLVQKVTGMKIHKSAMAA